MNLLDRIFSHPALRDSPPVLVDVGASGGAHGAWQKIARYAIGLGFEPDRRETAALAPAQRNFRRWIFSDRLVVADDSATAATLYLTRSPYCSSTLPPDQKSLAEWSFADLFEVVGSRSSPVVALAAVLREHQLGQVDWLKCDTQGTDLRIFQSLSPAQRARVLVAEFEPGIIDAYQGEDKLPALLTAMESEPFWLVRLETNGVPRGSPRMLERRLGNRWARLYRILGPLGPGWVNAVYLRRFARDDALERREYILGWVFASLLGQPAYALEVAEIGKEKFGDPFFDELAGAAVDEMRGCVWAAWRRWPGLLWHKLWSQIKAPAA